MKHPAPHVWADLAAGRLAAPRAAALEEHAGACEPCRAVRSRVGGVAQTMAALGDASPPRLNWERLGARVHWNVSSELRRREREREGVGRGRARRLLPFVLAAAAAVTGAVALYAMRESARPSPRQVVTPAPAPADPRPMPPTGPQDPLPQVPATARALEGVVTLAAGDVTVDGKPLTLDAELVRGSRIATAADSRVAVQFGDRSGFLVEPGSEVELYAFDDRAIELRVARGAVTVDLTRRADGQEFSVVAGARRVAVRGTIFRVERTADGVDVTCTRGRVAVLGGDGELELPAGTRLALLDAIHVSAGRRRVMGDPETARMAELMRVPLLAAWTDADQVRAGSAVVRVQGAPSIVKVDGVAIGRGSFHLRAASGRHLIESAGSSRWVETHAGDDVEAPIGRPAKARASERAEQLKAQFARHRDAIDGCARRIRKVDPEFRGAMKLAVEIGADGAVRAVWPVTGLPDADTEDCVLDVVRDRFTFPSGTAETVHYGVSF